MTKGNLYVISGPSGAGKGVICKKILEADDNVKFSVSMTTRSPRDGEIDKKDYYFVKKEEFEKLLLEKGLLEYNMYVNNYYGTPKQPVVDWIDKGYDVILEIDYHGAFQVKQTYPEVILLFVMPPTLEELEARIIGRGSENEETLRRRLKEAVTEMEQAELYDYRIVNDDINRAVREVQSIMKMKKSKEA